MSNPRTLRDHFHQLGNSHNNIVLAAGVLREILEQLETRALSLEESRREISRLTKFCDQISDHIESAEKEILLIKKATYAKTDPDETLV